MIVLLRKIRTLFGSKLIRNLDQSFIGLKAESEGIKMDKIKWYKKVLDWILDKWDDFWTEIIVKYEMVQRMIFWGWKSRHFYEWDYHSNYNFLYNHLKRMETVFEKHGSGVWLCPRGDESHDPESYKKMKSLKICIKILDRIMNDYYDDKMQNRIEKKYGKFGIDSEPIPEGKFSAPLHFTRNGVREKDMPNSKEYHEEMMKGYHLSEETKQRDKKILFELIRRDMEWWWD